MITVISPAKKLDLSEETRFTQNYTLPLYQEQTRELVEIMRTKSVEEVALLMDLSPQLAQLNFQRYQDFAATYGPREAKQAILCFNGDVYQSLELDQYTEADFAFAQENLRILSGLFGVLRPLDLIQPYRLEMGTALKNPKGKDLYAFWGTTITQRLQEETGEDGVLINLASNEYFKAVQAKQLKGRVITPVFKEKRNGKLQSIFLYAKQARGSMANFIIREKITGPEALKGFMGMGYTFDASVSKGDEWVFVR